MPVTLLRKGKLSRMKENGLKSDYLDKKKDKRQLRKEAGNDGFEYRVLLIAGEKKHLKVV